MSSTRTDGISLVMPLYNGVKYLATTLRSIEWDSGVPIELLVVDGGSTDGSIEMIEEAAREGRNVKLYRIKSNQAEAINFGIAEASYEVVNWLNSDDVLTPGALARIHSAMSSGSHEFCYGDSFTFDNSGRVTGLLLTAQLDIPLQRTCGNIFTGSLFFSKSAFLKYGPLDSSLKVTFEYKFYDSLFANSKGLYLPRILAGFRVRPDSISQAHLQLGLSEFHRFREVQSYGRSYRIWQKSRKLFKWIRSGDIFRVIELRFSFFLRKLFYYYLGNHRAVSIERIFRVNWHG